jgi:Pyruvate/2-oxoacid:ferredoxin oxidoreductase gamma subunit
VASPRPHGPPHDVLAAEEFPPPAGPDANTGAGEPPHDVLAAEEFAIPAAADAAGARPGVGGARRRTLVALGAASALLALVRVRRRR